MPNSQSVLRVPQNKNQLVNSVISCLIVLYLYFPWSIYHELFRVCCSPLNCHVCASGLWSADAQLYSRVGKRQNTFRGLGKPAGTPHSLSDINNVLIPSLPTPRWSFRSKRFKSWFDICCKVWWALLWWRYRASFLVRSKGYYQQVLATLRQKTREPSPVQEERQPQKAIVAIHSWGTNNGSQPRHQHLH